MENSKGFIGSVIGWFTSVAVEQLLQTYLLPVGFTAMTGVAGYLQQVPWILIFCFMAFSFACATHGMVKLNELMAKNRIAGQIFLSGFNVFIDKANGQAAYSIEYLNTSTFTLSVKIEKVECAIDNVIPSTPNLFDGKELAIFARAGQQIATHGIDCVTKCKGKMVEGFCRVAIRYGKNDKRPYTFLIDKKCRIWFDRKGGIEQFSSFDAELR